MTIGRIYGRIDSAAFDQVEAVLARLEGGAHAQIYASGMAAGSAVAHALGRGAHVIAPREMYYEMRRLLEHDGPGLGLELTLLERIDETSLAAAWRDGRTRLVWLETPSNPFWSVTDIAAVASFAHARGARVVVDSTAATPVLTQPLALGADLVLHAATKYLNGHSDVLAGALVTAQRDETGSACAGSAAPTAPCSARSRRGCCCAECARCICACTPRRRVRCASPNI